MAGDVNVKNGNGNGTPIGVPSVHVPKPGAKQNLRQNLTRDPYPVIPHISTYSGKYNTVNKDYYIYWDEALRNSQANTLSMRRDGYIEELLNHRRLPIISLPFHMETDDPEHPDQVTISEMVNKIVSNIPRLKNLMVSLMEAIFYGRYAAQIQLGPRKVAGNEWTSIVRHVPINGDKMRFHWDGTPGIAMYSGERDAKSEEGEQNKFLIQNKKYIENTMLGPALYLKTQALRDRFIIHNFQGSDTDYLFEIDQAQSVFGVGLRSRLYWTWNLRTEIWSWIVDSLQRIGASGLIYGFYPISNQAAQKEALNALSQLVKDNIGVFPVPAGFEGKLSEWLQRIEPSPVGYEVMERLVDKLDGIMRRTFLGQDLSSESKPTGIGGGAAELHADVRQDIIQYDAEMLAETFTEQLVSVILRYNTWKYEGKSLRGDDLPFSLKWVFDIDKGDGPARLEAASACFAMGVELDKNDVRKAAGFSPPKKKADILTNPEIQMQQQQNQAGVPQYDKAAEHLKGIVGQGKEAQKMGMMSPKPGMSNGKPSRFVHAGDSDDCGHERKGGEFTEDNTCSKREGKRDQLKMFLHSDGRYVDIDRKSTHYDYSRTKEFSDEYGVSVKDPQDFVNLMKNDFLRISSDKNIMVINGRSMSTKQINKIQEVLLDNEKYKYVYIDIDDDHSGEITRSEMLSISNRTDIIKLLRGRSRFSKPKETFSLAGRLYLSQSGWGLMKVPNNLVRGIFDALHESGAILPPQDSDLPKSKWKLNAHVSVLRPEEIDKIGGSSIVTEWGNHFHYQLGPIKKVDPDGWDAMKEVYFIDIDSPELEDMREKYGLSRLPNKNKFRFHITVAVKLSAAKGSGLARFSKKDFHEGGESISSSDKKITSHQVGEVLTKQYYNKKAGYTPEQMEEKWLTSSSYKLIKDVPIWILRPYKYEAPDDLSHSKGPLIVDADKRSYKERWGAFGSNPEFLICDGKHRWWMALRAGKKTYDCFVGDSIYEDMDEYIKDFSPKRARFIMNVNTYYRDPVFENKEEVIESGLDCDLSQKQIDMFFSNFKKGIKFDFDYGCFFDKNHPDPDGPKTKSKFSKADDCGHTPSGSFSENNTCNRLKKFTDSAKSELTDWKKEHKSQRKELISDQRKDWNDQKKDHAKEMKSLLRDHAKDIKSTDEDDLESILDQHATEIANLKSEQKDERHSKREDHQTDRKSMKETHLEEKKEVVDKIKEELKEEFPKRKSDKKKEALKKSIEVLNDLVSDIGSEKD